MPVNPDYIEEQQRVKFANEYDQLVGVETQEVDDDYTLYEAAMKMVELNKLNEVLEWEAGCDYHTKHTYQSKTYEYHLYCVEWVLENIYKKGADLNAE